MKEYITMDTRDLVKAGNLSKAREQLIEEVKSLPADMSRRTLLFQVLSFCGEWDKAERHLDIIATQDSSRETGVQVYKNLIRAEKLRTEVLKRNSRPAFLPEVPAYAERYFSALKKLSQRKTEEATDLFNQIDEQRPVISGTVNGKSFTGIRDTDTLVSIFLETVVHEQYIWMPFESLKEIIISPPKTLFDYLWIAARITTQEGLSLHCYLPVLYHDSWSHRDDRIKMGRMTDWISLGGPFSKGSGQRIFQIGEDEIPIMELREVTFSTSYRTDKP